MNSGPCGICQEKPAKYRCPKCSVKYCSLACYKDTERHKDDEPKATEPTVDATCKDVTKAEDGDSLQLTPELKELLRYNTVKFHLGKVYRILKTDIGDTNDPSFAMTSDMKRQLAIDYLNTLRYGGIHHNEAIEEFCEHSLKLVNGQQD
ncbi:hypothetical protein HG536_0G04430 [Torulaspora globosa]|uniref:HIT-type domain-containing protein n=1 Tax=Torulaspora globosa TaxID=48254 RepID=A0A7G3ZM45_9SACH|nr:uncharacterized protein HG536_0G04430 [Torulaspora globosa]QLL34581.1 hypothetical protein HG536_0G04430 [Torulaspora globosa]